MIEETHTQADDSVHLTRLLRAMEAHNGEHFFASITKVLPHADASLPYFLARFQMGLFTPELFERHAIDYPRHIQNSVVKRQAEFIAGRLCARSILDMYGHGQHVVSVGSHREPLWPTGFIGSITHSGQYAAAIACPDVNIAGIGIDIETIINDDSRQAMIDLVAGADEVRYLLAHPGSIGFDGLLTLVFSVKESFFKAAFPQVRAYFDFDAVRVFDIDPELRTIRFHCEQDLSEQLRRGQTYLAHYDFIGDTSVFTAVLLTRAKVACIPAGSGAAQDPVNADSLISG
jgi:4'-phosphopantetheinyl transferase EntD